jgi:hypothetical protein
MGGSLSIDGDSLFPVAIEGDPAGRNEVGDGEVSRGGDERVAVESISSRLGLFVVVAVGVFERVSDKSRWLFTVVVVVCGGIMPEYRTKLDACLT